MGKHLKKKLSAKCSKQNIATGEGELNMVNIAGF